MRAFALLHFFAATVFAVDHPSRWDLWGDSGSDCSNPSYSLKAKKIVDPGPVCQPFPGDYESYHFTDQGGVQVNFYEDENCSGSPTSYKLNSCVGPDTLKKTKYFWVSLA
ncbi:hypothetical protein N7492_004767 [Penicillium capsulatum]|uniref:Uncharacterized protein n=1 Tax=Penicillium capsulatum TaxID=69766 RepID=A0A9W9IAH7_9EURO|nr:hypothetical protein N7492_004767 [Penicillium capsulatum]KAJ6136125.1 hypothetical protein N7512_001285 [Penicillium capsulatum]